MTLATRIINGNNSGAYSRRPKIVVMHATRSGRVSFTDAQELGSTMNWFVNPLGASAQWIVSKLERVRAVADTLIAWHSARLNPLSWGIEFTQPTIDRTFGTGHYANAALIGKHYVRLGVEPVWLDYWDGNLTQSGFVDHEDTVQGRASGKSDMGYRFDRPRFIASLEVDMPLNAADKVWLKALVNGLVRNVVKSETAKTAKAAVTPVAKDTVEIRNSLRGGDLPGLWWKVKGMRTIYYVELVGGVLVRHHVRNATSYTNVGGNWKVIEVSQTQLDVTIEGPPLPNLKV